MAGCYGGRLHPSEIGEADMPHKFNQTRRHKFEKAKYRVSNWRDYEAGLRRRGDVTLWISESALSGWVTSPGKRGIYSNLAIETSLALRLVVRTKRRIPSVWCHANHYLQDSRGLCEQPCGNHPSAPDH